MKTLLFLLLIPLCFAQSQVVPSHSEEIVDSLLQSEFVQAGLLYESMDRNAKQELFDKISVVDSMSTVSCEETCNAFNMQRVRYDSSEVPVPITGIYEYASHFVDRGDLRYALKVYFIAFALRKDFVEKEKRRLFHNYSRTKDLVKNGAKDSIIHYIRLDERENTGTMAYALLDQQYNLRRYYRDVKEDLKEKESIEQYELDHFDAFEPEFYVSVGFNSTILSRQRTPPLRITDNVRQLEMTAPSFPLKANQKPSVIVFPDLSLSWKLYQALYMSAHLSFHSFTIRNVAKENILFQETIHFDQDDIRVNSFQWELACKYFFRPRIGIRPFIEAGFGTNYNSSSEKKLYVIYTYTYSATRQNNASYFCSLNLGTEYAHSNDSIISYGVKFGFDWFVKNTLLTGELSGHANLFANVLIF